MTSIFTFFVLLAFVTLCVSSDLSPKADPCSKRDRCSSKSSLKTCSCDSDCHAYGTCCHDISKPDQDLPSFQCYSRRTASPVLAKRSCSEDFLGHVGTKGACLEEDEDEMDVKNNLLVTSRKTKVTYWNKQCGICSNEDASDLDFWDIVVLCPTHKEIDRYMIRRNLTFDQDNLRWGIAIGDDFLECSVKYSPYYDQEVKHCTPNVITKCPDGYDNEDVSTKCSQYYAERKLKNSDTYFKNIHCAVCNGVDVEELVCPGLSNLEDDVDESDFRDMVDVTFTNGEWLYKEPGKTFECSRGYLYDPFREKCRSYEFKEDVKIIPNVASELRKGFLVLLSPIVAILYKVVVFENFYASQQNVRTAT